MAASNPQRFLADAGVDDELALEMFSGWVTEAFSKKTHLWNAVNGAGGVGTVSMDGVVSSKIVTSGKSEQFIQIPAEGPSAEYHTPGQELLGQEYQIGESTVAIDGILVRHHDLPIDQIQISHFDALRPVANSIGRDLARDFDQKLIITGIKGAQTAAKTKGTLTLHNGGNVVERVAATAAAAWPVTSTGATNLIDDIGELAYNMDEDNVPEDGRFLLINPYVRRVLLKDSTIFNRDLGEQLSNDLNRRIVGQVAGFNILEPTTNIPTTNLTTGPSKYQQDFTVAGGDEGQTVALALCGADEGQAAVGYVAAANEKVGPISTAMVWDERRNTWFLKGQMMVGAGVLAPFCAGEIHVDDA